MCTVGTIRYSAAAIFCICVSVGPKMAAAQRLYEPPAHLHQAAYFFPFAFYSLISGTSSSRFQIFKFAPLPSGALGEIFYSNAEMPTQTDVLYAYRHVTFMNFECRFKLPANGSRKIRRSLKNLRNRRRCLPLRFACICNLRIGQASSVVNF